MPFVILRFVWRVLASSLKVLCISCKFLASSLQVLCKFLASSLLWKFLASSLQVFCILMSAVSACSCGFWRTSSGRNLLNKMQRKFAESLCQNPFKIASKDPSSKPSKLDQNGDPGALKKRSWKQVGNLS